MDRSFFQLFFILTGLGLCFILGACETLDLALSPPTTLIDPYKDFNSQHPFSKIQNRPPIYPEADITQDPLLISDEAGKISSEKLYTSLINHLQQYPNSLFEITADYPSSKAAEKSEKIRLEEARHAQSQCLDILASLSQMNLPVERFKVTTMPLSSDQKFVIKIKLRDH